MVMIPRIIYFDMRYKKSLYSNGNTILMNTFKGALKTNRLIV